MVGNSRKRESHNSSEGFAVRRSRGVSWRWSTDRKGAFQYVASCSSYRNLSADGDDPGERKKLIF